MGQKAGKRVWIAIFISAMISMILYVIIYKCFPMVYAINDDVAMRDIASGAASGDPDAHLIFMKYVLGILISGMYRFFPGFDWYGLLMTGFIMLSLGILLYRGLSDIKSWKNKWIYVSGVLILFLCVGLQHTVIFQWTMTAGIVGATGIFFFYTSPEQNKVKNILEEIVASLLLILTYCIRSDVLLMIVPAGGICYLFKYVRIRMGEKPRLMIRHAWFWILTLGGCAVVMLIESIAYQSEDWIKYQSFNNFRSEVYDFYGIPEYEENQDFYSSIHMGEEEVEALENYSLFLVDGIFEYKMEAIAEYAKNRTVSERNIFKRLIHGIIKIYTDFESGSYAPLSWFAVIATATGMIICWRKRSKQFYLVFACMGVQFFLWCYLGLQGRIVERVSFAMHMYMLLLALSVLYKEFIENSEKESKEWAKICESKCIMGIGCMLLLMVTLLECNEIRQKALQIEERNQENIELNQYLESRKENIYLIHTYSTSQYTDVFHVRRNFETSNLVSLGGWRTFSPTEVKKREILGIPDVKEALYTQENVYVVSRFDMAYVDKCLQKAYGSCYSQDADVVAFRNYLYWIKRYKEL